MVYSVFGALAPTLIVYFIVSDKQWSLSHIPIVLIFLAIGALCGVMYYFLESNMNTGASKVRTCLHLFLLCFISVAVVVFNEY